MKIPGVLLFAALLSACGTYNAADTMATRNDMTTDMARCGGGLGIDNKVGLMVKLEAAKSGGELSAQQSSEIYASAVKQGLITADGKSYDIYVKCILELDKRRTDKQTLTQIERIQQPALKVYLDATRTSERRLVVENTGSELTELEVTPAPFLVISDLCLITKPSDCQKQDISRLETAYIPIENFYSPVSWYGSYTAALYSVDEAKTALRTEADKFTQSEQISRTGSMTSYVITLVRLKYKDKFQMPHERYMDVSIEQRELPADLGQSIFELRTQWIESGKAINALNISASTLTRVWNNTRSPKDERPNVWSQYLNPRSVDRV